MFRNRRVTDEQMINTICDVLIDYEHKVSQMNHSDSPIGPSNDEVLEALKYLGEPPGTRLPDMHFLAVRVLEELGEKYSYGTRDFAARELRKYSPGMSAKPSSG